MTDITKLCSEMDERDRWWAKAFMVFLTAQAKAMERAKAKDNFTVSDATFSVTNEDYKEMK